MAFIPTPHGARAVVLWTKGTENFSYVFYATKPGFDSSDLENLAAVIDGWHTAAHMTLFSSGVTYSGTVCYDARTIDGETAAAIANTRAGGNASEVAPINTAICVTLRTTGRGRSARGRKYITGFGEGGLNAGEWTQLYRDSALAYVNGIHGAINGAGWTHVIRSIQSNNQPVNPAVVRAVDTLLVRNGKVATQRRRVDRP